MIATDVGRKRYLFRKAVGFVIRVDRARARKVKAVLESSSAQFARQPGPCKFPVPHNAFVGRY
jgi:hypothetical protein